MGPQCTVLLLIIHFMTVTGYAPRESPIIAFHPKIKSHQEHYQQLKPQKNNQQSADNRIASSITASPKKLPKKSIDSAENNSKYFIEYEPMKINAIDINQRTRNPDKTGIPKKIKYFRIRRINADDQTNLNDREKTKLNNGKLNSKGGKNVNKFIERNIDTLSENLVKNLTGKMSPQKNLGSTHRVFSEPESIGSNDYDKVINKDDKFEKRLDDNVGEVSESNTREHREPESKSEKREKGGDEEHHEDYLESEEEEGKKGYESHHEHEENEKGHHDKESHNKNYDEEKGNEKKHLDDSEYHKHYESGEKKEKDGEFEEKGKFSKGHSTKGDHVIHKKDEYEKLVEFYDESHEEDGNAKDSEFYHEFDEMHGGSEKSGHTEKYGEIEKHGRKKEYENGHHYDEKKGHDSKNGREKHHDEEKEYGKKGENEKGKKWMYEQ